MRLQTDSKLANKDHETWMALAEQAGSRSNCVRRSVGALLVKEGLIASEGWNGVSADFLDCREAGCPRCINGGETGSGYETCICIHAEQRAIADAAKNGISTSGSTMYVTLRPCLQCLAICRAAGVREIFYSGEEWEYPAAVEKIYHVLSDQFDVFNRFDMPQDSPFFQIIGRIEKH